MAKRVTTATLIRGQVYNLRHPDSKPGAPKDSLRFNRGVPIVIDDPKIAKMLEEIVDETTDGDGEVFEKPVFKVEYGVEDPTTEAAPRARRLDPDRKIKTRRRRIA
jgi:hypothetical protein